MTNCGIYSIACNEANAIYVGQSYKISDRWKRHMAALEKGSHNNRFLQRLYNKYPLTFKVEEECPQASLTAKEQYWIDFYRNAGKTIVNNNPAGPSRKGVHHTPETIAKIAAANKGHKVSEETKKKISDNHKAKGIKPPGHKGGKHLIGNKYALGNKLSEETKKKIGKASKGNRHAKGHRHSPEQLKKISEASKRMWEERRKK